MKIRIVIPAIALVALACIYSNAVPATQQLATATSAYKLIATDIPTLPVFANATRMTSAQIVSGTYTAIANQVATTVAAPTRTPIPTPTFIPLPQPIILKGFGDSVVDVAKWNGPALLHAQHNGSSNFVVRNYGPGNKKLNLLVNTIGIYEGIRPLDFFDDEDTVRFEIKADGQWELQIIPFDLIQVEVTPTVIKGRGDDVIGLIGDVPDLLKVDASQTKSNFVIWGWGSNGRDLLVNEIGPYTGIVILSSQTKILEIKAEGNWSIEVTTK